jgi:hypothetical protein
MGSDAIYDAYILISTIAHTALVKSKTQHSPTIIRMRMQASGWREPAHALGRVGCTEKDILRNRIILVKEYCC